MRTYSYILILLSLYLFSCNSNKTDTNTKRSWVSTDTVLLPIINPVRVNSYYNKNNGNEYVSFIDVNNMKIYLIINDSNNNRKEHVFSYKEAFRNFKKDNFNLFYFFKDTNSVYIILKNTIYPGSIKQSLVQIFSNGKYRTLKMQNRSNQIYYIQPPNSPFSFIQKDVFFATCFHKAKQGNHHLNDYQINSDSRKKEFSQPPALLFEIKDSIGRIIKEYGTYPKSLLDTTKIYYSYFPKYTLYNNKAVVFTYSNFDTLYHTKNGKTTKYAFKSRNKHNNPVFDMKQLYNYNYIMKYGCETSNPMYIKYNSRYKLLYLTYIKYQKFENKDGTMNRAVNNPFSIIVFDSLFHNIGEFDISKEYSKFNSFTTSKGLALKNNKLSKINHKATYVIFTITE